MDKCAPTLWRFRDPMLSALPRPVADPTDAPERVPEQKHPVRSPEWGFRGRSSRRSEAHLRKMEPVILLTPRWSHPQGFLEDIALDLAVGEPAVGCRTVSLRPLQGKDAPTAWQFFLRILGELGQNQWFEGTAREVVERRGFRHALTEMLDLAQARIPYPVALLTHGAEILPAGVAEDLFATWEEYISRHGTERRCVLLLAGAVDTPSLLDIDAHIEHLSDYGEEEAMSRLGDLAGRAAFEELQEAARFSGGVPSLVEALGHHARNHGALPRDPWSLLACLGPLADELRYVVDIAMSDGNLGARLESLQGGRPLPLEPGLDPRLILSGLARRVHWDQQICVSLRAPALDLLLG